MISMGSKFNECVRRLIHCIVPSMERAFNHSSEKFPVGHLSMILSQWVNLDSTLFESHGGNNHFYI